MTEQKLDVLDKAIKEIKNHIFYDVHKLKITKGNNELIITPSPREKIFNVFFEGAFIILLDVKNKLWNEYKELFIFHTRVSREGKIEIVLYQ